MKLVSSKTIPENNIFQRKIAKSVDIWYRPCQWTISRIKINKFYKEKHQFLLFNNDLPVTTDRSNILGFWVAIYCKDAHFLTETKFAYFLTQNYQHFHFPSWICSLAQIEINCFEQKPTRDPYIRSESDTYSSVKPEAKKVDTKLPRTLIQEDGVWSGKILTSMGELKFWKFCDFI